MNEYAWDDPKAKNMVSKVNWTLLPFKHLALIDESISNISISRSRSPIGLTVTNSKSSDTKHREALSTFSSTEESYGSMIEKHNSVLR